MSFTSDFSAILKVLFFLGWTPFSQNSQNILKIVSKRSIYTYAIFSFIVETIVIIYISWYWLSHVNNGRDHFFEGLIQPIIITFNVILFFVFYCGAHIIAITFLYKHMMLLTVIIDIDGRLREYTKIQTVKIHFWKTLCVIFLYFIANAIGQYRWFQEISLMMLLSNMYSCTPFKYRYFTWLRYMFNQLDKLYRCL